MRFYVRTVIMLLSVAIAPCVAIASTDIFLEINEFSEPSSWSVQVSGRASFVNIVAPDGRVLEPRSPRLRAGLILFEETFDSPEDAFAFVSGDWLATEATSLFADELETVSHSFSVSPLSIDDLNRSLPVVSSPTPMFEAVSGESFLLAWDFVPTSDADEVPDRSAVWRRRTDRVVQGSSRASLGTPSPGRGSYVSGGGADLSTSLESEPGADSNRWLFTANSTDNEPLEFEILVGSEIPLDDLVDSPLADPANPSRGSYAELSYSRFAAPIQVSLEPRPGADLCVIPQGQTVGDFDGDGTVGFPDFLTLSANFRQQVPTYEDGDTNCDGTVEFGDFLTLSMNFGRSTATAAAVPEPSTFGLLMGCWGAILACRARSR